jgi:hypothetical protein
MCRDRQQFGCLPNRSTQVTFRQKSSSQLREGLIPLTRGFTILSGFMGSEQQLGHPVRRRRSVPPALVPAVVTLLLALPPHFTIAQSPVLPDAPKPQGFVAPAQPRATPCQVHNIGATMAAAASLQAAQVIGSNAAPSPPDPPAAITIVPCPPGDKGWYDRFVDGPKDKILTPKDKAWLAARNVVDPINAGSIVVTSGIVIGANSHSPYGPGMAGFGRNVGVAYAQDMTGEFFGTFLIPSIFHQNPHYHRMPHATIPRRLLNTCTQVFWVQSDTGHGMLNYANIIGYAIDDEIGNLYVPGRATNLPASATRYATTFLFEPTNNVVSEFLPDVAGRINTHYVFLQRIINTIKGPDIN